MMEKNTIIIHICLQEVTQEMEIYEPGIIA